MVAHGDINHLWVSSSEQKATAKGVTFVRVVVKGIGPGRLVSRRKHGTVKYLIIVSLIIQPSEVLT